MLACIVAIDVAIRPPLSVRTGLAAVALVLGCFLYLRPEQGDLLRIAAQGLSLRRTSTGKRQGLPASAGGLAPGKGEGTGS
jgi:hypothetical protein